MFLFLRKLQYMYKKKNYLDIDFNYIKILLYKNLQTSSRDVM